MSDIVGLGCAVFDFMLMLDSWPQEDTKLTSRESKIQCGGPCAVAMIAAHKLGFSTEFIGKLGGDVYGLTIKERLDSFGVDTSALRIVPDGDTMRCVVLSNRSNSSRTCIVGGGVDSGKTALRPEEVDPGRIRRAKILHLDGNHPEAAVRAAEIARSSGVKVCLDAEFSGPETEKLLALTDYLIPAERFVSSYTGIQDEEKAAWKLYREVQPEVLVITQGPRGGIVIAEDTLRRYPAYEVDAIDTNGAGDVFHGAYLAGILRGMHPYEAACFASAASAIKCTRFGASEGAPYYEEVEKFLKEGKI